MGLQVVQLANLLVGSELAAGNLWSEEAHKRQGELTLLTSPLITQLVALNDALGLGWLVVFILLSWFGLLRVVSECFPLQKGCANEAVSLPAGRHSAVWVDHEWTTHIRFRRRKHRPNGALMSRPCTCKGSNSRCCLSHRLVPFLARCEHGRALFSEPSSRLLKRLRAQLSSLIGPLQGQRFSWKAFRAGHATELAERGLGVPAILAAGDWRSGSFLSYVRERELNEVAMLRVAWEQESDDDEAPGGSGGSHRRRWDSSRGDDG